MTNKTARAWGPTIASNGRQGAPLQLDLEDCIRRTPDALRDAAPELLAALKEVAGILPVAGQLHPKDLQAIQTLVVAAIEKAQGTI